MYTSQIVGEPMRRNAAATTPTGFQREAARERVLKPDEIRTIWLACDAWEAEVLAGDERQARGGRRSQAGKRSITDFPRAVQLLFLTPCRAQEVGDLQWNEINRQHNELGAA
jgi:integrase